MRWVVKSTMAAETLEFVECAAFWIGNLLKEMLHLETSSDIVCNTDSHQLYDGLHSIKLVKDKRLQIDVALLQVNWIHKEFQLADSLTKLGASSEKLLSVLDNMKIVE